MASSPQHVNVVLGAAGATGLACVQRLIAVSDLPTRAVVRDPKKLEGILQPSNKLQIVRGDVTDEASLREVLQGARGIIFAASGVGYFSAQDVDFKGVQNVATVAKEVGADRVVLVSSMLVSRRNWWHPVRCLLNNIRYKLMDYKLEGENALRASGVGFTVVRPGGLTKAPGGQSTLITGQGDSMRPDSIGREDVAAVCVAALTDPAARNITMEVASKKGLPAEGYEQHLRSLFAGMKQGIA